MSIAVARKKLDNLRKNIAGLESAALAFSGGVDSTFLLKVGKDVLGKKFMAVTAQSPTYPKAELEFAKKKAGKLGVELLVIKTREMKSKSFTGNPPDRCYYCKGELFREMRKICNAKNIKHVIAGNNADDLKDFRPGMKAGRECGVRNPLAECGLTKNEIRLLSREMGLDTWDKPSMACLASRFPYGRNIKAKALAMVEKAERCLTDLGFAQVRVRHYGDTCRIEVLPEKISALAAPAVGKKVAERLKKLGYKYITIDIQGYRTGSMNETLEGR